MTGNKAYLAEYQDFNGGPIAFGGSKGYITGKGKIKTGKLDFEDVCFVKELQHFNLFFVSQMCDKKNKVLFTNTECLVLSPEFKLPDENQVLLRIPRQNNMYSFNLENIVPSRGLACLIAKATIDESNKWHRRLGHVNFKNLNKLGVFRNIKREGKGFSGRVTPLFPTMMVQAQEEMGKGSANPTDPYHTPIITQPSTSKPQKKQNPRKPKRKDTEIPQSSGPTEPIADEAANEENVPTHSNDPLLSGEDSLKLNDLMDICTKLQQRKKGGLRTHKLKRLFKVGRFAQVVSSEDKGLGDQEDASKQRRKIDNIDQDTEVTLVNETQGRYDDAQIFDTDVLMDKGKAKMIKLEKPLKMKEQIKLDEELAFKLQAEEGRNKKRLQRREERLRNLKIAIHYMG
ncbi:ribonuclease H-like domain-containing protein [Tanacetum coccineum]